MKHPIFDVFGSHMEFDIKKVDRNTVILESQLIPFGSKKGHKYRVMFDFEKVADFTVKENDDGTQTLIFVIDNAKTEYTEVDRTKNEST